MPIKVTCKCGQGFVAKERLAGRTLKCPKCDTRLKIPQPKPAGQTQPSASPKQAGQPAQPQPKQRQQPAAKPKQAVPKPKQVVSRPKQPAPKPTELPALATGVDDPMADLLAEAGLDGAPAPGHTCPSCGAAMSPGAILCVACGYNQQSGRQLQTRHEPEDAAEGGALSAGGLPRKGQAKGAMNVVALGLGLLYWALLLLFGSVLLAAVCLIGSFAVEALMLGMVVVVCGLIVALAMNAVGWLLCLAVPSQTGAKGLIIASLVLTIAAVLSPFVIAPAIVAELEGSLDPRIVVLLAGLVGPVLILAANISFLLFLRQLAEYVRRSDLAEKAQLVIQVMLLQIVVLFILVPLGWLPPMVGGLIAIVLLLGLLVLAVCVLFQYATLLRDLRKEIRRPTRR